MSKIYQNPTEIKLNLRMLHIDKILFSCIKR